MRRFIALLFSTIITACGGPAAETAQVSPTPLATETSVALSPSSDAWLEAIPSYTYQEQACDPADPRLAKINLPPEQYREGRVAAACVALEWLDNKDLTFPKTEIFVPDYVSSAARRSIEQSAEWQLRVVWGHRTYLDVTPTVFLFDTKSDFCGANHVVLPIDFFVYRDCVDIEREWTCEDNPGTALAATPNYWSGDKPRAGNISYECRLSDGARVNPYKFYASFLYCDTTAGAAAPLCAFLSKGAMYIYGLYIQELGEAESVGRMANLDVCTQATWVNTCPSSTLLFRKYIPSSSWLTVYDTLCNHGSDPYGESGDCSAVEHFGYVVNGLAFEWVTAHYGIDTAYGIINATLQAGRDKERYLRVLSHYLGMSTVDFFAAIDTYVVARLGDRIR